MKPLIVMPIVKGQTDERAMEALYALEWDGQLDILLLVGGDDAEEWVDNIVRKYNEARDIALSGDYTALMTIESDMIVPPDAVKRLAVVDADVAYGLYVWQNSWPFWSAYTMVDVKQSKSISEKPEVAKKAWGKVIDVEGIGNGCTLIHRRVLEAFPFRRSRVMRHPADWELALSCQDAGFVQKCDTRVICGHIQREPVPMVLWPDVERRGLYRATDVGPIPEDLETNKLYYGDELVFYNQEEA